ncbi:MAG: M28 family metallopeptidase [Candidatus Wallbacteria bacterium]|nr:M28 family metallopeptidase [Candidatus Wallbacteria bacterium]
MSCFARFVAFLMIFQSYCQAQTTGEVKDIWSEFKSNALLHVQNLAALGCRSGGSENDAKARAYVIKYLEKSGLTVEIEPFSFEMFMLEKATLQVGATQLEPELICFNPYLCSDQMTGEIMYIQPDLSRDACARLEIADKIVVTAKPVSFLGLAAKKSRAILYFDRKTLESLKDQDGRFSNLIIRGRIDKIKSANLIASLNVKPMSSEILLSAHLDSIKGPGADDNGSGSAVLLELCRSFRSASIKPPCNLKFIFFGAEELGLIGAKAYLEQHSQELSRCELLFNLDSIGGSEKIYLEMEGGLEGSSKEKGKSQFPEEIAFKSHSDYSGKWKLLHPIVLSVASCVPLWLKEEIMNSGKELGIEITPSRFMGSDHLVFAQAGICSTDIAAGGNQKFMHTADDKPENVNPDTLEKAGRIVAKVVTDFPWKKK